MKKGEIGGGFPYPPKAERMCCNCEWWDEDSDSGEQAGECRVRPPNNAPVEMWPYTYAHDWCGEFQTHSRFHLKTEERG